jgi:hypothetical protein
MGMACCVNAINWFQPMTLNLTANSMWSAFAYILNVAIAQFVSVEHVTIISDSARIKQVHPKRIKSALAPKHCLWRRCKSDPDCSAARHLYRRAEN